jgi:hypothetical protein
VPPREERQVKLKSLLTGGLVVLVVVIWLGWWQWDRLRSGLCGPGGEESVPVTASDADRDATDFAGAAGEWEAALAAAEQSWTEWTGVAPSWPGDLSAPADCEAVEEELARICRALDADLDPGTRGLPIGSCQLIQQVAEELARRPPTVSSELRSYETVLANVFHLFRTVGRRRIDFLREVAREEQEHAEPIALALYRWLASRESCARSGQTAIGKEPLYEYAGFLFQTMGGQAYLRRRTPKVEALGSFYALLLLDRAVEADHNPHGVDPRPEIRRTLGLLDAQPFVFGDRYRTVLEEMRQRWESRDTPS